VVPDIGRYDAGPCAYEDLSVRDQDDFQASVMHWGELAPGHRALQTRMNDEHDDPLIVAIKSDYFQRVSEGTYYERS
jgi:hypothetical protein